MKCYIIIDVNMAESKNYSNEDCFKSAAGTGLLEIAANSWANSPSEFHLLFRQFTPMHSTIHKR
jgi:hypothetical protein